MKVSKLFTIDVELAERLRQTDNSSALVNKLLKEYFEIRSEKNGVFEEKKAIFDDLKKKMREYRKDVKVISDLEALKLDNFSIRWIRGQKEQPNYLSIRRYIKERNLTTPTDNFIKAWSLIKEHGNLFKDI